ncbi:hypothetical protein AC249_AIPGENE23249 [Exaiptasia diaphana]|nr:hypothetical protein AC249_AIPGENE23249 [Exaiptasia diaphana]
MTPLTVGSDRRVISINFIMTDQNIHVPTVEEGTNVSQPLVSHPGPSGVQHEQLRQPADILSQPGSQLSATLNNMNQSMSGMADLLRQLIEENRAHRQQRPRRASLGLSDSEDDSDHPPSKRRRADDEISLAPSDEDIHALVHPDDDEPNVGKNTADTDKDQQESDFLKSLEAEYADSEPLGPKINESLANIARKRWGVSLTAEKLKTKKN